MRISDWGSDVCSSDLCLQRAARREPRHQSVRSWAYRRSRSPQRIFGNLQIRMWLAAARLHQRRRNEGLSRAPSSRLRRSVRRPGSRLIRRQSSFPSLNQDSDMTALAEITDALHKLRVSFVQSLVNVAAQRIGAKGMDHGPVLINVSGSTIGIRSMIDEVGQILGLERLYIDITSDGQSFELSLPAGADIDRPAMRFVILDGCRNDRARASTYLRSAH